MKTPAGLQPLIDDGVIDEVLRSLKSGKEAQNTLTPVILLVTALAGTRLPPLVTINVPPGPLSPMTT